jgi:predicted esterase
VRYAIAFALVAFGCSSGGGGPHVLFDLHQPSTAVSAPTATDDFYALPFPNALRVRDDGTIDLSRYPQIGGQIGDYITAIDQSQARFQNTAVFFRLDGPVDPATLPADAMAALADGATVFAVDLTTDQRLPVRTRFTAINYDFIGPNWIAVLPEPGFPFHEGHDIAVLVTDGVHGSDGKPVERAADLDAVLSSSSSSDAAIARAHTAYAPLETWLAAHADVAKHLAGATYFNAGSSTKIMADLRAAVYAQVPTPPTLDALVYDGEDAAPNGGAAVDDIYEGTYQGPNFQQGDSPYSSSGGAITNPPTVQKMETLRIAITVPKGTPPAAGWPVVIYQHGTGGDYKSFIGDGSGREAARVTDASGNVLAQMAMIGTDQVLHGTRSPAGTDYDTAFFNFVNLPAAHDNPKQGALDAFSVVRLIHTIDVASAPTTGAHIKFDPSRIYFKGHSQGGLTGPLFLSAEPEVKAAILSGAGGGLISSLLHKTEPVNIPQVVQGLLHDPVDEYHPLLSLIQGYFEDSDPVNYARLFFREPPAGLAPKSIFQTLGIVDHYTPIPTIETLALAMGVQPAGPQLQTIDDLPLTTTQWGSAPITGNVAGGQATGVLLEYTAPAGDDGHFVVFDVPDAVSQSNRFLASHAATGTARLDPP